MKKFGCTIIHAGSDKTGSTSIQVSLDRWREPLLNAGSLAYPPGQWHAQLSSCFSAEPEQCYFNVSQGTNTDVIRQSDARYLAQLRQWLGQVPSCKKLVFSYEGFLSLDAYALARLREFALEWSNKVKIVAYVRHPLSYAMSAVSQRAKVGVPLFKNPPYIPWKSIIQTYLSVFEKKELILRKFSYDTLDAGDVVTDFIKTLKVKPIPSEFVRGQEPENESLSDVGMLLSMKIIERLEKRKITMSESAYFALIGKHLSLIPGEKIHITPEQVSEIINKSRDDIEYLLDEFGISFTEAKIEESDAVCRFNQNPKLVTMIDGIAQFVIQATLGEEDCSDFAEPEFALLTAELKGERLITTGSLLSFVLEFSLAVKIVELLVGIHIYDRYGRLAFATNSMQLGIPLKSLVAGTYRKQWTLVADLPEGEYKISFTFSECLLDSVRMVARYGKLLSFSVIRDDKSRSQGYVSIPATVICSRISDRVVQPLRKTNGRLCFLGGPSSIVSGETVVLQVLLENDSVQDWVSLYKYPISLSYHWLNEQGEVAVFDGERTPLPGGVLCAGDNIAAELTVKAPDLPGRYRLCAMPVQELVAWFDKMGFTAGETLVDVF